MLAPMRRFFQSIALMALFLSLNSCGLPAAVGRSAGRLVQSVDGLLGPAAAAAL